MEIHDDATEEVNEVNTTRQKDFEGDLLFKDILVKIVGSVVRLDKNGSAYTCYIIAITYNGTERWRIEKRYSNFLNLEEKVNYNEDITTTTQTQTKTKQKQKQNTHTHTHTHTQKKKKKKT